MFKTKIVRNLVIISLVGNLLGDSDVYTYMRFFVPMESYMRVAFSRVNIAGGILLYLTGFIAVYLYIRPVDLYLGGQDAPGLEEKARRRTLNFPLAAAGFWAILWAAGGPFFYIGLAFLNTRVTEIVRIHLALSVVSGGVVTVFFVYFLLEHLVRRWLVVPVFKGESVTGQAGVRAAGIKTKMIAYYLAAMFWPILIMGGGIYLGALEMGGDLPPVFTSRILVLIIALCSWGVMVGAVFVLLMNRNITEPILELKSAMDTIRRDDLDISLPVVSTDELGMVRNGFNEMVKGLKERDFVKETFGRYVSRQVSDAVLNGRLRLGGETRDVTILLCDIRDFTAMSESLEPEEVVAFLNTYFAVMVDVIIESCGMIDKFIGDAFLAVYGAPVEMENHPSTAARAAIRLRSALETFNRERTAGGKAPIRIGISIHSGRVVAGNIGSLKRTEYTVIGDTVNVAARIEGLNSLMGTDILISEAVYHRIKDSVHVTPMAPVAVKGKAEKIQVYQLLDMIA